MCCAIVGLGEYFSTFPGLPVFPLLVLFYQVLYLPDLDPPVPHPSLWAAAERSVRCSLESLLHFCRKSHTGSHFLSTGKPGAQSVAGALEGLPGPGDPWHFGTVHRVKVLQQVK